MQSIPSSSTAERGTATIPVIFNRLMQIKCFLQFAVKKTLSEPLLHFPSGHKKPAICQKTGTHTLTGNKLLNMESAEDFHSLQAKNKVVTFIKRVMKTRFNWSHTS